MGITMIVFASLVIIREALRAVENLVGWVWRCLVSEFLDFLDPNKDSEFGFPWADVFGLLLLVLAVAWLAALATSPLWHPGTLPPLPVSIDCTFGCG